MLTAEKPPDMRRRALSHRAGLQASIAAQLAANHGRSWIYLPEDIRSEYLEDAGALIDQGLTPWQEERAFSEAPSLEVEAEVFEFDRAMTWFMEYLDGRHPDWRATGVYPSSHIEQSDPDEWDAWVTVALSVSEEARQVWSQRFAESTGEPIPLDRPALEQVPASAPRASQSVIRDRAAAAIGAALAYRHGRRWMDLPSDIKAAYRSDAYALMDVRLTCI